ncbi:hypothetical protein D3C75_1328530 [compost metagenome]
MAAVRGRGLQLRHHRGQQHRRVLGIEQQPVKTAGRHQLGAVRMAERDPQPGLVALFAQRALERVDREFHAPS